MFLDLEELMLLENIVGKQSSPLLDQVEYIQIINMTSSSKAVWIHDQTITLMGITTYNVNRSYEKSAYDL